MISLQNFISLFVGWKSELILTPLKDKNFLSTIFYSEYHPLMKKAFCRQTTLILLQEVAWFDKKKKDQVALTKELVVVTRFYFLLAKDPEEQLKYHALVVKHRKVFIPFCFYKNHQATLTIIPSLYSGYMLVNKVQDLLYFP